MKKLVIAMITFMLLATSLSTATFAWIAMAKTNLIDDIHLVATLGDDLEISLDGINYYNEFPREELTRYLRTSRLTGVTSFDGINFSFLNNERTTKNVEYLSFDFHFRTTSRREHDIYLANNISNEVSYDEVGLKEGTYVISKGLNFRSEVRYLYDVNEYVNIGEARTYYASDALRISTNYNNEIVKIFDLSENEHRGYGKEYGAFDYYNKVTTDDLLILPTEIPHTIYKLSEFSKDGPFSYDEESKIMVLEEIEEINGITYYKGKITLNIWLEGWDADLFDPVIQDRIKIKLQFKAVRNKINK